jgi:Spy/CpxP family protein refolding chaperone
MKRATTCGVFAAAMILVFSAGLHAQPPGGGPARPGGPGGFGGFGGGFGFGADSGGGTLMLLLRPDVRGELELLDHQVEELTKLREDLMNQMREMMAPDQNLSWQDRMQRMREMGEKVRADADEKLKKILLPHQVRRLDQLNAQNQLRMRGGLMRSLMADPLAEDLALTDAQKEALRAKAEKLNAELQQKIAELRNKAQEELLKELTPQQQAKIKERFGEPFEFQRDDLQFGRGGPGGPGGPPPAGGADQGGRGGRGFRPQRDG